jgi:molybdate transport system regulatory protein
MAEFPSLSLRVLLARDTSLGPGKADLLQGIRDTNSIAAAGRRMGMSSKRAWYLIETMNSYFGHPLVIATKGGKTGGGGHNLLARAMPPRMLPAYRSKSFASRGP